MKISCDQVGRIMATELRAMSRTRRSAPAGGSDQVDLSQKAADIQAAHRALDAAPPVREDKVAALRAQIEQGTYHVPSRDLADAILREAALQRELGS